MNSPEETEGTASKRFVSGRLFERPLELEENQILPVYYAVSGFGSAEADTIIDAEASGGGGMAIPLGAYVREGEQIRFRPNPISLSIVLLPLAVLGCGLVKALARRI